MIAIDTSAIFAIAARESERDSFLGCLDSEKAAMTTVSYLESVMVLTGRSKQVALSRVDELISVFRIEIVAVDRTIAAAAIDAFERYGKGRHPARLNLSDCFSYALARARDLPLLFKGGDFAKTDIVPAWRP
jgi:ribonuclease VapC